MKIKKEQLYTTKEVAEILKVSLVTIKRYIADNKITSVKFNGIRRIRGKDILRIINPGNNIKNTILIPFRFPGGKYYAIKKLRPFWESVNHDEYREPLLGGGAVFWAKEKAKFNWLNDIDKDLMSTLIFIKRQKNREKLIKLFENELETSKDKYNYIKNFKPKNKLEKVYRYYYLNRTSYNGKMINPTWGYRPKRSLPPYRWKERIVPCGEKLKNVMLTAYDFEKVINSPAKGNSVLIFLDPPYFAVDQRTHYKHSFNLNDHLRLANILRNTKFKFFLTYDNCKKIRDLYSWANIYDLKFYYRVDNSRDSNNKRKIGDEIVITNYKISQ